MITAREIIHAAYARSMKTRPGVTATDEGELLPFVGRSLRAIYSVAARVDPTYFAATAVVAGVEGGWLRPAAAESIFDVEHGGARIALVSYDQRWAEALLPAVYFRGGKFWPAGNPSDPDPGEDSLTLSYSKIPGEPAGLDEEIDSTWVEQFNELLILEVAVYLARKEPSAAAEVPNLVSARDHQLRLYVQHLQHHTTMLRLANGHIRHSNTQTTVPIGDLMAGGSNVQIPAA